jgi:hypothetical protein
MKVIGEEPPWKRLHTNCSWITCISRYHCFPSKHETWKPHWLVAGLSSSVMRPKWLHGIESFLRSHHFVQLLKNFPTFHGTPKVHYRLHKRLYPEPDQSSSYHPPSYLSKIRFNIIRKLLSLDLPSGNIPYTFLFSPIRWSQVVHSVLDVRSRNNPV